MSYTSPSYGLLWDNGNAINTVMSGPDYLGLNFTNSGAVPAADMAVYSPVLVKRRCIVRRLFLSVLGAAGNVDIGVYDALGTRLVSSGLTAAASDLTVDVTDTVIGPGLYYLAFLGDTVTTLTVISQLSSAPFPAAAGIRAQQMGAGGSLPATASWTVNQTLDRFYVVAAITGQVVA